MRAACVQLCTGIQIGPNLAAASDLIRQAAADGATFIATPENTHLMQRRRSEMMATIAPEEEDLGVAHFSRLAKELGIHLLIGSMAIKIAEGRGANRSFLFGTDGRVLARYDKIHMFDVQVSEEETWMESRSYQAGKQAVIADIEKAKAGLSICYDLRFPGLYRSYAQAGADIITVPAAFTRPTGRAHWETLLRARAIETGAYVLAPAQGGTHEDGRKTWGHSMIIDPWGDIIALLDHDRSGFICADLDLSKVAETRGKIPAWRLEAEYAL
jgi:predicted amidohydrolase